MLHKPECQLNKQITILREDAEFALAGFHVDSLAWSNRNLDILYFAEGGKGKT